MRIIGGEARSRLIDAPKGMDTRPTQDKVRESLFNILQWNIEGRHVLDLFAGSGALGLEAISRGADDAIFVDVSHHAAAVIQSNIEKLGFGDRAKVIKADWRTAISGLSSHHNHRFDLIFLDPPYKMDDTGEMCLGMLNAGIVADNALFVIEHSWDAPPKLDLRLRATDVRRYGSTGITFCTPAVKGETE